MAEKSKIQWCDATFNPWRGCTKVSPGCAHCYAEVQAKRNPQVLGEWGPGGTRVVASEDYWRQPLRWDQKAKEEEVRRRVFCASLADVFEDRPELVAPRRRLWDLIVATPNLDWLLLTKRPENVGRMLGPLGVGAYAAEGPVPCPQPNVWIGASVEDQEWCDERVPLLMQVPARIRFLSVEPLLGPVQLPLCFHPSDDPNQTDHSGCAPIPDWVIVGGESGHKARPCNLEWVRSIVGQCKAAGVSVFVKQLGSNPVLRETAGPGKFHYGEVQGNIESVTITTWLRFGDRKGGDPGEWPEDLRVREFPRGV